MGLLTVTTPAGDLDVARAVLRSCPPSQVVRLSVSATGRRGRLAEVLRASARAHDCHLALAETGGITARWVDGIVAGRAEDVAAVLATLEPLLGRAHGRCAVVRAA